MTACLASYRFVASNKATLLFESFAFLRQPSRHLIAPFAGCLKLPSFNHPGVHPAVRCSNHKEPCMVNVRHRACRQVGCGTEARPSHHPCCAFYLDTEPC